MTVLRVSIRGSPEWTASLGNLYLENYRYRPDVDIIDLLSATTKLFGKESGGFDDSAAQLVIVHILFGRFRESQLGSRLVERPVHRLISDANFSAILGRIQSKWLVVFYFFPDNGEIVMTTNPFPRGMTRAHLLPGTTWEGTGLSWARQRPMKSHDEEQ